MNEKIRNELIEVIKKWRGEAILAAYYKYDLDDSDYKVKTFDAILEAQFEAECEIRELLADTFSR